MAGNITEFENKIKNLPDQELIEKREKYIENLIEYLESGSEEIKQKIKEEQLIERIEVINRQLDEKATGLGAAEYKKIRDIRKAISNNEIDYTTIQDFKVNQFESLNKSVKEAKDYKTELEHELKQKKEEIKSKKEDLRTLINADILPKYASLNLKFDKIKEINDTTSKKNKDITVLEGNDEPTETAKIVEKAISNNSDSSNIEKNINQLETIYGTLDEIKKDIDDELKNDDPNDVPNEKKLAEKKLEEIGKCKEIVKKIMPKDKDEDEAKEKYASFINELEALEKKIREIVDTVNQHTYLTSPFNKTDAFIKANDEKINKTEGILNSLDKWKEVFKSSVETNDITGVYNNKNDKTKELNPEEAQKKLQSLLGWEPIKTQNNIVRSTKRKKGAKDDEYRTYKVGDWNFEYSGNVETNGNEITISDNGKPFLTIEKNDGKVEKMEVHQDACLMVEGKPFYIPEGSEVNVEHTNDGVIISVNNGGQNATITVKNGSVTTSGDSFINWENRPKKEEQAEETARETKIEADTIEETPLKEARDINSAPEIPKDERMEATAPLEDTIEDTEREAETQIKTNIIEEAKDAGKKEAILKKSNKTEASISDVNTLNSDVKEEPKVNNFFGNVVGEFKNILSGMGNNNEQTSERNCQPKDSRSEVIDSNNQNNDKLNHDIDSIDKKNKRPRPNNNSTVKEVAETDEVKDLSENNSYDFWTDTESFSLETFFDPSRMEELINRKKEESINKMNPTKICKQ